ncbi:MAG: hypothetical protein ABII09_00170 [Planctomycetota bacterium]
MKLYKFRSLANKDTFDYLKEILETDKFHCSRFSDLNDPLEGVYYFMNYNENREVLLNKIFTEKEGYKICSFSHEKAFSNPILWGYYANGFRGVAVEVDVGTEEVREIKYEPKLPRIKGEDYEENAIKILTTKLCPWGHECEYRFMKKSSDNKHKIGNITALYFGDPYQKAHNRNNIVENSNNIRNYLGFKKSILNITREKNLPVYSVTIKNNEVIKVKPNE